MPKPNSIIIHVPGSGTETTRSGVGNLRTPPPTAIAGVSVPHRHRRRHRYRRRHPHRHRHRPATDPRLDAAMGMPPLPSGFGAMTSASVAALPTERLRPLPEEKRAWPMPHRGLGGCESLAESALLGPAPLQGLWPAWSATLALLPFSGSEPSIIASIAWPRMPSGVRAPHRQASIDEGARCHDCQA